MKKIIKIYKEPTSSKINLPKSILEETQLDKEEVLLVENKGRKIILTKVENKDAI